MKAEFERLSMNHIHKFIQFEQGLCEVGSDEKFRGNVKIVKLIFRCLQLLCEGHNDALQNHLRDQSFWESQNEQIRNINFIDTAAISFGLVVKYLNPQLLDLGENILDFLIESIQGPCVHNQRQLFNAKIVDYCNDLFIEFMDPTHLKIRGFESDEHHKQLNNFVIKCVRLINALLEANYDPRIIRCVSQTLCHPFLIETLTLSFGIAFWQILETKKGKSVMAAFREDLANAQDNTELRQRKELVQGLVTMFAEEYGEACRKFNDARFLRDIQIHRFSSQISDLFELYFLIKFQREHNESLKFLYQKMGPSSHVVLRFFECFTGSVEIVHGEDILRFYFIKNPACFYIEKEKLRRIIRMVKRDTPKDKIKDIVNFSSQVFTEMEHRCNLFYKFSKFGLNLRIYHNLKFAVTIESIIINSFIFLFFRKRIVDDYAEEDEVYNSKHIFLQIMGILLFLTCIVKLIFWFFIRGSVKLINYRKQFSNRLKKDMRQRQTHGPGSVEVIINYSETKANLLVIL